MTENIINEINAIDNKAAVERLLLALIEKHTKMNDGVWIGDNYGHREVAVIHYLQENSIMQALATPGRGGADFLTANNGWGEIKTAKLNKSKSLEVQPSQQLGMFDNISKTKDYFSNRFETVVFAIFHNEGIHTLITIKSSHRDVFFAKLDQKREEHILKIDTIPDADKRKRAMTRGITVKYSELLEWVSLEGLDIYRNQ